jgi:glycosyltransferase involved in cell wall biosynthesis
VRLVILAHGSALADVVVRRDRPNPGIGGTQFTRIRLADAFARRFPQHTVELVSDHAFSVFDAPGNLRQVTVERFEDHLAGLASDGDEWVLTGPSMLLCRLDPAVIRRVASRTIMTSHLMYDCDLWEAERIARFGAVAGVGAYHYHSLRPRSPRTYLRDLFLPGWSQPPSAPDVVLNESRAGQFRIVHLGALLPLKGFHDFARMWPDLRDRIPDVQLDVIGGSETYGREVTHPEIPTDGAFGDRILRHIPLEDIRSSRVVFHGNLGAAKEAVVRRADVAVLNVTGRPECFPGALLECLDLGVPVVGSAANGLWDGMRHFPETTTVSPTEVVDRLVALASNPDLRRLLAVRARSVGERFRDENETILDRWEEVATAVLERRDPPRLTPQPAPRPAWRLLLTHWWNRGRYELSRSSTLKSAWRMVTRRSRT